MNAKFKDHKDEKSTLHERNKKNLSSPGSDSSKIFKLQKSPERNFLETKHSPDHFQKDSMKLKYTLNAIKNKMKPTNEELEYRKNILNEPNVVESSIAFFKCTKCDKSYKSAIKNGENISVHSLLQVLMCKNCCEYYGDGNFSIDSDGEDKYCRWCGEGGTIFTCSKCICGFCHDCIKRNFGMSFKKKVLKDKNWLCLICNSRPLWHLRFVCSLVEEASESQKQAIKARSDKKQIFSKDILVENHESTSEDTVLSETNKTSTSDVNCKSNRKSTKFFPSSSEDSEEEMPKNPQQKKRCYSKAFEKTKSKHVISLTKNLVLDKLKNVLQLTEYQMEYGRTWSSKKRLKLSMLDNISSNEKLLNEFHKIKWFLSNMSTHLIEFCNIIDSLEKNLSGKKSVLENPTSNRINDISTYSGILGFLDVVTNHVKAFMEKGIDLNDLLDSETYVNLLEAKKKKENSARNETSKNINENDLPTEQNNQISPFTVNDSNDDSNSEKSLTESSSSVNELVKGLKIMKDKESVLDILTILQNA